MENKRVDKEFAAMVKTKLKHHLKKIVLFGSHARGDHRDDSDYDILVVVDQNNQAIRNKVLDACVEIMDRYFELIGCVICDEKEWELKKKFPIGINILKEGVEL